MFDFHERRKLRTLVYSKPVLAALAVVIVFLAQAVWGVYTKERETAAKKEQRAAALAEVEGRRKALEREIERLNSRVGIEAEIREKFSAAKEGEEVLVIVDPPQEVEDGGGEEARGFFSRIRSLFGF